MLPPTIWRAPRNMIRALTIPSSVLEARPMSEVAVSVLRMFSSSRSTPPAKTFASRSSAW